VVIGSVHPLHTPAGALEAFRCILRGLDNRFQAAVFLVIHTSADSPSVKLRPRSMAMRMTSKYRGVTALANVRRIRPSGGVVPSPADVGVLSLSLGVLVAVTLVAGFLPAHRAARVDPVKALRAE
jgi:ABC-type antimicrobial peptide transport system permease subunit